MEEKSILGLDGKIQKLITNYTVLKSKFADLQIKYTELRQQNEELQTFKQNNEGELERLEELTKQQEIKSERLIQENSNLKEQLENYETKMHEASSKIDNIFNQLNDI